MKVKSIFMGSALMMGLVFSGCTDDDDNCTPDYTGPLTASETLLVGQWTLSAINSDKAVDLTDDEVANPSTNIYAQYTDCQKDARYDFSENRNYDFAQGAVVPNCDNKLITNGTWQYQNNQIDFISSCIVLSLPITITNANTSFQSVSENLLVKDVTGSVTTVTWTFVYTKILPQA